MTKVYKEMRATQTDCQLQTLIEQQQIRYKQKSAYRVQLTKLWRALHKQDYKKKINQLNFNHSEFLLRSQINLICRSHR